MPLLSGWLTRARLSRVQQYLGKTVLDVGCGYGELLDFLPTHVEQITLIDRSPERRSQLNRRLERLHITAEFRVFDAEQPEWPADMATVDSVVMAALLEHLRNPAQVLRNLYGRLQSNGLLVMTTPSPWGGKMHWLGSRLGLTFPEAAEEHERFYDAVALQRLLVGAGFKVEKFQRFLLGMNQLIVARKLEGETNELH